MAAWTTPKQDWALGELVGAGEMNAIGENLAYLKAGGARAAVGVPAGSTASAGWGVLATLSITARGGALLIGAALSVYHTAGGRGYFDVAVDGVRLAANGSAGSVEATLGAAGTAGVVGFGLMVVGVAAGARVVTVQWRTSAPTLHVLGGQVWLAEL
jgi:hypothetical protein